MVGFPKTPPRVKPFSRAFSFYVTLGILTVVLWVLGTLSNGGGLPRCPKFFMFRHMGKIPSSHNKYTPIRPKRSREPRVLLESVQDVLTAIKTVTLMAASTGTEGIFDEDEEDQWHMDNPCRSRWELPMMYEGRKIAQDVAPNEAWEEVFHEYTTMHRTCIGQVGNITEHFLRRNSSLGCKFLVVKLPKVGLGNKILFKASALLFAVLTQRVILIQDKLNIANHLCEPFLGSTWKLDYSSSIRDHKTLWHTASEFELWVDKNEYENRTDSEYIHAVDLADKFQPLVRYYCNTEQAYMSKVPWISMSGCVYFLPKLFAIPSFRLALEEMFPDRMALTHILRSAFLPSDPVWDRIDDINDLYLKHTHSLVGVQLRYLRNDLQYKKMNDIVNKRVFQCVTSNKLLPTVLPLGEHLANENVDRDHHRNTSRVFIASIYPGLHDYLSEIYVRQMTPSGEGVGLVQLPHEAKEHFGPELYVEAFVEIICLSLSDALLVTPESTSGGLAQAYGALRPWFINFDDDGGPACERAQSIDVCFDQASQTFVCPHDPEYHRLSILDSVPYIEKCLRRDSLGVQLMTDHESNPC